MLSGIGFPDPGGGSGPPAVSSIQLLNDTGSSDSDKVTSDPTVTGQIDGAVMGSLGIEFDHFGDGSVDGSITQVGSSFVYDPSQSDLAVENHIGAFQLDYRTVEYDLFGNRVGDGSWETFSYTIESGDAPEIEVTDETGAPVQDGVTLIDFGATSVGAPIDHTFSITNAGTADLLLDASSVTVPQGFSLEVPFDEVVSPGGQTSFTVRALSQEVGSFSGSLTFQNNDSDETVFEIQLSADVFGDIPDIEVRTSLGENIESGVTTIDAGSTVSGVAKSISFWVQNVGTEDLNIDVNSISVPNGFEIESYPDQSLAGGGGQSLFVLRANAAQEGTFSGVVTIPSDDPDESQFQFDISIVVTNDFTISEFGLENDTGLPDGITYDPTLKGRVTGQFLGGTVNVEFDHSGDGVAEGFTSVDSSGELFSYDPREFEPAFSDELGLKAIQYRYVHLNEAGETQVIGDWNDFEFELVTDPSLGDLVVEDFGVILLSGASYGNGDNDAAVIPIVGGSVSGVMSGGIVKVEFDSQNAGVAEGSVTIQSDDPVFVYDLRDNHPALIGFIGTVDVKYRLAKYDEQGSLLDSGAWVSYQFELIQSGESAATFESIGLKNDTGEDGDSITSDPTISGIVDAGSLSQFEYWVEFDSDADGEVDLTVGVGEDFAFEARFDELSYGANQVNARIVSWSSVSGSYEAGDWVSVDFELIAEPSAKVKSLELAVPGDDSLETFLPIIKGLVESEDGGAVGYAYKVEYDSNEDGSADGFVWDSGESFEVLIPDLAPGSQTINIRTSRFDTKLDDYVYSDWTPITFELLSVSAPAVSNLRLVVDDGSSDSDGITTDARIVGELVGDIISGVKVEYDIDGDGNVDGSTISTSFGEFVVDPIGLSAGQVSIDIRATVPDSYRNSDYAGEWTSISFEYVKESYNQVAVSQLALLYPEPDDPSKTSNPVITGRAELLSTIGDPKNAGYQLVEVDTDMDGSADSSITTRSDGTFSFSLNDQTTGSKSIQFRARAWDYSIDDFVWSDWESFSFEVIEQLASPGTIQHLGLLADTGTPGDLVTGNATITGLVDNPDNLAGLLVEVDLDGDLSSAETSVWIDGDGRFVFNPGILNDGTTTISTRVVGWDNYSKEYIFGSWSSLTFNVDKSQDLAPEVTTFETASSSNVYVGQNVTFEGQVSNELSLNQIVVQFDLDGDLLVDGYTTSDEFGRFSFEFEPFQQGTRSVSVRAIENDFSGGTTKTGQWQSITLDVLPADAIVPGIASLELFEDTGKSDTDNITSNPTLRGQVEDYEFGSNVAVEFDVDGDGLVDGATAIQADGTFLFTPSIDFGVNTLSARVSSVAEDGKKLTSDWQSIVITFESDLATELSVEAGLANDTGNDSQDGVTSDPTIAGVVTGFLSVSAIDIEIDVDRDGVADFNTLTDGNGAFSFAFDDLEHGYYQIDVRASSYSEFWTGATSAWETVEFVMHSDPDGQEAQQMLSSADQYKQEVEAARNDYFDSLDAAQFSFRETQQQLVTDYELALDGIRTNYYSSQQTDQASFLASLGQANATFFSNVQSAVASYSASAPAAEFHNFVTFGLPNLFSFVSLKFDDVSKLPQPPEGPDFGGDRHDFGRDTVYQARVKSLKETLSNDLEDLADAYRAAVDQANDKLSQDKANADRAYWDAIANISYTLEVNPPADKVQQINELQLQIEVQRQKLHLKIASIERWYQQAMQSLAEEFYDIGEGDDVIAFEPNLEYMNRAADLLKQKTVKISDAWHAHNVVVFGLQKQIRDIRAEISTFLNESKEDATKSIRDQKAEIETTKTKAYATADHAHIHAVLQAVNIFQKSSEDLYADYQVDRATATRDSIETRKNAEQTDWWAYQLDIANNTLQLVETNARNKATLEKGTSDASYEEAKKVADQVKTRRHNIADYKEQRVKAHAAAEHEYKIAELAAVEARKKAVNEDYRVHRVEKSLARNVYEKDIACAANAHQKRTNAIMVWEWYALQEAETQEEREEILRQAFLMYMASNRTYAHAKLDAQLKYQDEIAETNAKYRKKYYEHEEEFLDTTTSDFHEYEKKLSVADHGQGGEGASDGYFTKVAKEARDLIKKEAEENNKWWQTVAALAESYSKSEATAYKTWEVGGATANNKLRQNVAQKYVQAVEAWAGAEENRTAWGKYHVRLAEQELARIQDDNTKTLESVQTQADAREKLEKDEATAYKTLRTDNASHSLNYTNSTADELYNAFSRIEVARSALEIEISRLKGADDGEHDNDVVDQNLAHEKTRIDEYKTLQKAINAAEFEYRHAKTDSYYDRRIGAITVAQEAARNAAANVVRVGKIANAEKTVVLNIVADWKAKADAIVDAKLAYATGVKSAKDTFSNSVKSTKTSSVGEFRSFSSTYSGDLSGNEKTRTDSSADNNKSLTIDVNTATSKYRHHRLNGLQQASQDTILAVDQYQIDSLQEMIDEMSRPGQPTTVWRQAHIDVATAEKAGLEGEHAARSTYFSQLTGYRLSHLSKLDDIHIQYATDNANAGAQYQKSVAAASDVALSANSTSMSDYLESIQSAEFELENVQQLAQHQFDLDYATARSTQEKSEIKAWKDYVTAVATKRAQKYIDTKGASSDVDSSAEFQTYQNALSTARRVFEVAENLAQKTRVQTITSSDSYLGNTTATADEKIIEDNNSSDVGLTGSVTGADTTLAGAQDDADTKYYNSIATEGKRYVGVQQHAEVAFAGALVQAWGTRAEKLVRARVDFYVSILDHLISVAEENGDSDAAQDWLATLRAIRNWVNDIGDDYEQFVRDQTNVLANAEQLGTTIDYEQKKSDKDLELQFKQTASGYIDAYNGEVAAADAEFSTSLADHSQTKANSLSEAEATRLKAYAKAEADHSVRLIEAENKRDLDVIDGVANAEGIFEAAKIASERKRAEDRSAADKDWVDSVNEANEKHQQNVAAAQKTWNDRVSSALRTLQSQLSSLDRSRVRDQAVAALAFSTQALDAATDLDVGLSNARADFIAADLAARVTALQLEMNLNGSTPGMEFALADSLADQTAWSANSQAYADLATNKKQISLNYHAIIGQASIDQIDESNLAIAAFDQSIDTAQNDYEIAKANAEFNFSVNTASLRTIYSDAVAASQHQHELRIAEAAAKLAAGEHEGNPYTQEDYDNDVAQSQATLDAEVNAARINFATGFSSEQLAFAQWNSGAQNALTDLTTASQVSLATDLRNANVTQSVTTESAVRDRNNELSQAQNGWDSLIANGKSAAASQLFTNPTSEQQLVVQFSDAEATKSDSVSTSRNTLATANNESEFIRNTESTSQYFDFKIDEAENARQWDTSRVDATGVFEVAMQTAQSGLAQTGQWFTAINQQDGGEIESPVPGGVSVQTVTGTSTEDIYQHKAPGDELEQMFSRGIFDSDEYDPMRSGYGTGILPYKLAALTLRTRYVDQKLKTHPRVEAEMYSDDLNLGPIIVGVTDGVVPTVAAGDYGDIGELTVPTPGLGPLASRLDDGYYVATVSASYFQDDKDEDRKLSILELNEAARRKLIEHYLGSVPNHLQEDLIRNIFKLHDQGIESNLPHIQSLVAPKTMAEWNKVLDEINQKLTDEAQELAKQQQQLFESAFSRAIQNMDWTNIDVRLIDSLVKEAEAFKFDRKVTKIGAEKAYIPTHNQKGEVTGYIGPINHNDAVLIPFVAPDGADKWIVLEYVPRWHHPWYQAYWNVKDGGSPEGTVEWHKRRVEQLLRDGVEIIREAHYTYRGTVPGSMGPRVAVDAVVRSPKEVKHLYGQLASREFLLYVIPFGASADIFSQEGASFNFFVSAAGDAAMTLTVFGRVAYASGRIGTKTMMTIHRIDIATNGAIAGIRTIQAGQALSSDHPGAAAAHAGEALLRIIGMKFSKNELSQLKKIQERSKVLTQKLKDLDIKPSQVFGPYRKGDGCFVGDTLVHVAETELTQEQSNNETVQSISDRYETIGYLLTAAGTLVVLSGAAKSERETKAKERERSVQHEKIDRSKMKIIEN